MNEFERQGGVTVGIAVSDFYDALRQHSGITIDHGCQKDIIKLYITQEGYDFLKSEGISFEYEKTPEPKISMKNEHEIYQIKSGSDCLPIMDFYPTYEAYIQMMYDFEENHPELCEIIDIGTLDSGRKILVAHIGDDLDKNDKEPNFLYTSTMHGDETGGFPAMLQLIDYLLCNYDSDEHVRSLVDQINIYINPLANPDGTYQDDNSTVQGARRRNANNVDLNRNYPDPKVGERPDNRPTQDETQFFIDFAEQYDIHLSCNIHGGAEVVNYPWDTFEHDHADASWWVEKCRAYADTAQHYSSSVGYMTDLDDGITNGFAWYEVNGGRQDHMTYFERGREMTLEISGRKLVDSDQLPEIWESNRRSFIQYMEETLFGICGVITDCRSGLPVEAEFSLIDYDIDNSSVFSSVENGDFYRYLDGGSYRAMITASGYDTLYQDITVSDGERLIVDIELCPEGSSSAESLDETEIEILQVDGRLSILNLPEEMNLNIDVLSADGRKIQSSTIPSFPLREQVTSGIYHFNISIGEHSVTKSFFLR